MSQLLLTQASRRLLDVVGCCGIIGAPAGAAKAAAAVAGIHTSSVWHRSPLKKVRKRGPFLDWTTSEPDPHLFTRHVAKMDERRTKSVRPPGKYELFSVHYDPLVAKMAGHFVLGGTRDKLRDIMNEMMTEVKHIQFNKRKVAPPEEQAAIEVDPARVIHKAVENCAPLLIIKRVFRGGFLYKVPCPLRESESQMRAFKFLREASKVRGTKVPLYRSLAKELVNASNNEGKAVHLKLQMHKECEENRAYANYRIT